MTCLDLYCWLCFLTLYPQRIGNKEKKGAISVIKADAACLA